MSEQEVLEGTLKAIPRLENESDMDYFERVTDLDYVTRGYTPIDIIDAIYQNSIEEQYFYNKGILYEMTVKELPYGDCYCNLDEVSKGEYKFCTSFYNGGTCLNEMLEEAFERINK